MNIESSVWMRRKMFVKNISMNMRKHKEYVEFTNDIEKKHVLETTLRNKFIPKPQPFVKSSDD